MRLQELCRVQPLNEDWFADDDGNAYFTMQQMKRVYDCVFNRNYELSNLKKTLMNDRNLIVPVERKGVEVELRRGKPVELFQYNKTYYDYYMRNKNLSLRL